MSCTCGEDGFSVDNLGELKMGTPGFSVDNLSELHVKVQLFNKALLLVSTINRNQAFSLIHTETRSVPFWTTG